MYENIPDKLTNIIVTGKSGAGKQPRIDVLVDEFDLEQLSTGNIFRSYLGKFNDHGYSGDIGRFWQGKSFVRDDEIADVLGTDDPDIILGLKAKFFVDRGLFVPDHITNELFKGSFAKRDHRGQVLDGYPRTLDQAKFLMELLEEEDSRVDFILRVDNDDEMIVERTVNRRICPDCGKVYHLVYKPPHEGKCEVCDVEVVQRSDDTEEKIRSRLKEFKEKVIPAMKYLEERGIPIAKVPGHLEKFTPENVRKSVLSSVNKVF